MHILNYLSKYKNHAKKKSTENNVEVVNNNKSYSETQSLNQDLKLKKKEKKHREKLGDIIKLHDEEKYKLIQHWCSVECQTAIKACIDGKVQ